MAPSSAKYQNLPSARKGRFSRCTPLENKREFESSYWDDTQWGSIKATKDKEARTETGPSCDDGEDWFARVWTGKQGETYTLEALSEDTWKCWQDKRGISKEFTLRTDSDTGLIWWGNYTYYFDPWEVDTNPNTIIWHSTDSSKPDFHWRAPPTNPNDLPKKALKDRKGRLKYDSSKKDVWASRSWYGTRGETYELTALSEDSWKCKRIQVDGDTRDFVLRTDLDTGLVWWGNSYYYFDPQEVDQNEEMMIWHSADKSKIAFEWRVVPLSDRKHPESENSSTEETTTAPRQKVVCSRLKSTDQHPWVPSLKLKHGTETVLRMEGRPETKTVQKCIEAVKENLNEIDASLPSLLFTEADFQLPLDLKPAPGLEPSVDFERRKRSLQALWKAHQVEQQTKTNDTQTSDYVVFKVAREDSDEETKAPGSSRSEHSMDGEKFHGDNEGCLRMPGVVIRL